MASRHRFTVEELDEILRLHAEGWSIRMLVEKFGHRRSVYRHIQQASSGFVSAQRRANEGEVHRIVELWDQGKSRQAIGEHVGRSDDYVTRLLRRAGIEPVARPYKAKPGDRVVHGAGYILVHVADDDPLASMRVVNGIVLEHRLVMARELGRPLQPYETVHHINGIRDDNRLENLQLRSGNHGMGVAHRCRSCGSTDIESTLLG